MAANYNEQKFPERKQTESESPVVRLRGQSSVAGQSNSDMHSSHRSKRSRRFRIRKGNNEEGSSRMDNSSTNSGLMSRTTKKRSIRKGGKRSVSLAMQNEILITKI